MDAETTGERLNTDWPVPRPNSPAHRELTGYKKCLFNAEMRLSPLNEWPPLINPNFVSKATSHEKSLV